MSNILKIAGAGSAAAAEETDENFNQTVLLLHGDGTNGAQNNTFLDSSTNNFPITRSGNTTQGTFSPFSTQAGGWSNYFDGSGDYLSFGDNLDIVANDFTFECFVYFSSINNTFNAIFSKYGSPFSYQLLWDAPNNRWFWNVNNGTSTTVYFADTIVANQWYYLCLERTGTSYKLYRDGSQIGTTQTISGNITDGTRAFAIGISFDGNNNALYPLNGYVSNFRAVIGSNVYGSAPSIPTSPLTAISGTSLLTCQSNRFVDNSSNAFAITRNGDVKVTPFSPFAPTAAYSASVNGGSAYLDGTGDYLSVADDAALELGASNFTLEAWAYPLAFPTSGNLHGILAKGPSTSFGGLYLAINSSGVVVLYATTSSGSWNIVSGVGTLALTRNQFNHVALSRDGSSWRLWVNGASSTTVSSSSTIQNTDLGWKIASNPAGAENFNGYLSEVRILVGGFAYDPANTTLTIPTAPLTAITNTQLLLNFTNAGIFDNTGKNNLETVGNAQIDTTTKKYGTGSMEFDGTGDWLFLKNTQDLQLGSGDFTVEFWVNQSAFNTYQTPFALGYTGTGDFIIQSGITTQDGRWIVYISGSAIASENPGTAASTGVWYHIAVVRSGSTVTIYRDGVSVATGTSSVNINSTANIGIGASVTTSSLPLYGFIDDLRITKGVARYTSNFTAPTKAFPDL